MTSHISISSNPIQRPELRIALLKPHAHSIIFWKLLAKNSSKYGRSVNVWIANSFSDTEFRHQHPDIIVFSDCSGCAKIPFTRSEIKTILNYVQFGHNKHILATYAAFYYAENERIFDNTLLCQLFNLKPVDDMILSPKRTEEEEEYKSIPLLFPHVDRYWDGVIFPFKSSGYYQYVYPPHELWENYLIEPDKTKIILSDSDMHYVAMLTQHSNYASLYFNFMIDWGIGEHEEDIYIMYKALMILELCSTQSTLFSMCCDVIYKNPEYYAPKILPTDICYSLDKGLEYHGVK